MPFISGAAMVNDDLKGGLSAKINKFLGYIDTEIQSAAQEMLLAAADVRLLHPINFCAISMRNDVIIVSTHIEAGGMARHIYIDWEDKPALTIQSAVFLVERDLTFKQAFGISFPRSALDEPEEKQKEIAEEIARKYLMEEQQNLEKLKRIVRINPMFQGRDFLLRENSVFMLSPFSEPFNTIYVDHIKPTVESVNGLSIMRANDIYDTKPIIEDIWKSICEARLIIAELTDRNPNVFYEVGISHTVGKEVILITQRIEDVPFDLRHLRCIVYEYTPRGVEVLQTNLKNTIVSVLKR